MTWNVLKALRKSSVSATVTIQPPRDVYDAHVAILRRIKAPEDVIKIAEDAAAETTQPRRAAER